jgi:hypothetical protein
MGVKGTVLLTKFISHDIVPLFEVISMPRTARQISKTQIYHVM